MKLNAHSYSAASMHWPRPVFWRASSASAAPNAPYRPGQQRERGAERAVQAGDVVGHRHRDARGRPVLVASEVAQAAHRLANDAVAGALAVGPVLAKAADAHHHQARVALRELLVAQAPLLQAAGAEVLHHHVAARSELGGDPLALRAAQVDADHRLVAENAGGVERHLVVALAHGAHRVAFRGFDLDHLGAEVGQQATAERPGHG